MFSLKKDHEPDIPVVIAETMPTNDFSGALDNSSPAHAQAHQQPQQHQPQYQLQQHHHNASPPVAVATGGAHPPPNHHHTTGNFHSSASMHLGR